MWCVHELGEDQRALSALQSACGQCYHQIRVTSSMGPAGLIMCATGSFSSS